MRQVFGALCAAILALPAMAQTTSDTDAQDATKLAQCELSANMIGAVQQARLDRVRKGRAAAKVMNANAAWPDSVKTALPTIVEFVYGLPRKDLTTQDLRETTRVQCLQQYEQVQGLTGSASN